MLAQGNRPAMRAHARDRAPGYRLVWRILAALAVLVLLVLWRERHRTVPQPAGVLAAAAPLQETLAQRAALERGAFRITPAARFSMTARVLSRADYHFGKESEL